MSKKEITDFLNYAKFLGYKPNDFHIDETQEIPKDVVFIPASKIFIKKDEIERIYHAGNWLGKAIDDLNDGIYGRLIDNSDPSSI